MFIGKNLFCAAASRTAVKSNIWNGVQKKVIVEAPETKVTTIASGLRIASESFPIQTATVGVWIDGGSRYETPKNNGVAHFLEHMNFKGTKKRTQLDLELEVENLGAHLNAYTSREHTVYFAKCFSKDVEKAVEILSDILLNSVYGSREIEIERSVILREMEEVEQNLQEVVFDHLHAGAYKGCSLSGTILGPIKNIQTLNRPDFLNYIQDFYKGPKMVLCGAGGIEHEKLVELAQKYFNVERGSNEILKFEPGVFKQSYQIIRHDDMKVIYGCLAVEGPSWTHPDSIAMQLANTILGQYNSAQNQGLSGSSLLADYIDFDGVDSFMSFTTNYKDTGLAGVYFSVLENQKNALEKFTKLICDVWRQLAENEISEEQLNKAKRSLFTNMLLMLDGSTPICEDIGRQFLCYNRRISVPEIRARIDAITPKIIKELARMYLVNQPFAYTIVGGKSGWSKESQIEEWLTY